MLADGAKSFIRLRKHEAAFAFECLLAMRNVEIPEDSNIEKATGRMIELSAESHEVPDLCDTAKTKLASYAVYQARE